MSMAIVTGSAGFIGHHLARELLELGWNVVGIDNFLTGLRSRCDVLNQYEKYTHLDLDLANGPHIPQGTFDFIFHLAAIPRVQQSIDDPGSYYRNNIISTFNALEMAREGKVKKFVYASSSSVYGTKNKFPTREDHSKNPESPYALSKWIGEELCELHRRVYGVKTISLRFFNVYGPGMTSGGYATVLQTFFDQYKNKEPLTIRGDGSQERDFTHVRDVVKALILAAHSDSSGAFNIGSGAPKSVQYIASLISGNQKYIDGVKEPQKTHADRRKAIEYLNWVPHENFETSIETILQNVCQTN